MRDVLLLLVGFVAGFAACAWWWIAEIDRQARRLHDMADEIRGMR